MMTNYEAWVAAVLFPRKGKGAAFALGDGTVRFETGEVIAAHDGGILCAALHPSGEGVLTGGDDGKVVWSRVDGFEVLADLKRKWIDALAVDPAGSLIAFASGRTLHVRDVKDATFERAFAHERSVAAVAFDPKGRRIAAATYGGMALWYARIADQKPQMLKWAGSHMAATFSPDGRFLLSAMQENALHGWRLSDGKDMRMGGYPAKPRSMTFLMKGALLATSGANGAVVWPFAGANGPMGREAAEIGHEESSLVTQVAAVGAADRLVAGTDDGRVWFADLAGRDRQMLKAEKGAPITALAVSPDGGRVAWGDETGGAGVVTFPA